MLIQVVLCPFPHLLGQALGLPHFHPGFHSIYLLLILQDLCQQPLGCSCPSVSAPRGIVILPLPCLANFKPSVLLTFNFFSLFTPDFLLCC